MVDITSRMNRRELLDRIAQRAGVGADTAEHVVDAYIQEILEQTGAGRRVTIPNFGSFYPMRLVNRRTTYGDVGRIPDHVVLKFAAARPASVRVHELSQARP